MYFSGEFFVGFNSGRSAAFDEYGRRPWAKDFKDTKRRDREWNTFHYFQGEFAKGFGPTRRSVSYSLSRLPELIDDPAHHKHHLDHLNKNGPFSKMKN